MGRDDAGDVAPDGTISLTLPAGGARMLTAQALENGGNDFTGSLGDGTGKWRLSVTSNVPIDVMSLLQSPTGHLANLSSAPAVTAPGPGNPGSIFRDCPECPAMAVLPGGSFMMGAPEDEVDYGGFNEQRPVHEVSIRSFAVGVNEVTRGDFRLFVSETNFTPGPGSGDGCWARTPNPETGDWVDETDWTWLQNGIGQTDNHPVICVNWHDANAYAAWLSMKTGQEYRLLTESEWEYAARAGTTTARYWGDSLDEVCRYENTLADTCDDGYAQTAPVGSYAPNGYKLHDMLGNVFEFVEDCLNPNYEGAPTDGSAWLSGNCNRRILRGGTWRHGTVNKHLGRSAYRTESRAITRSVSSGFRVARTLP